MVCNCQYSRNLHTIDPGLNFMMMSLDQWSRFHELFVKEYTFVSTRSSFMEKTLNESSDIFVEVMITLSLMYFCRGNNYFILNVFLKVKDDMTIIALVLDNLLLYSCIE